MKFRLQVNISEEDYLNFNVFWLLRSPYGKNQKNKAYLIYALAGLTLMLLVFVSIFNLYQSLLHAAVSSGIIFIIYMILILRYPKSYRNTLKRSFKNMKKTGKMAYPPNSVLEFYDDYYVEIEPDTTTKQNYTVFERISFIPDQALYIHTGNARAILLPVSCFASEEERNSFMQFIASKCPQVDTYRK